MIYEHGGMDECIGWSLQEMANLGTTQLDNPT
jgi:hypothetical protein